MVPLFSTLRPLHLAMRSHIREFHSWLLLFYIWSVQWITAGAAEWYGQWKLPGWFQPGTVLAASVLSCIILLGTGLRSAPEGSSGISRRAAIWVIVPFAIAIGSLLLLEYVQAVDPLYMDLFRSLLLAFFLSCLGVLLGLELVMLGVWLFGICLVTGIWYVGFTPIVLQFMGGLALLSSGWIISRWSKPAVPPSGNTQ